MTFQTPCFSPSDRNSELDQQQEQYRNLKWKLERRLEELDGELALQRQVGWGWVSGWPLGREWQALT